MFSNNKFKKEGRIEWRQVVNLTKVGQIHM